MFYTCALGLTRVHLRAIGYFTVPLPFTMKQGKKKVNPQTHEVIDLKGVRVNNLKNISLQIPRGQYVVVTGVSGSGKSSLAFDTLYAEGQRRYVESLSSYARQFLGRKPKPEADWVRGMPPAIAIEQRVISRNPRSTVATSTEIYEYLRLLYARVGRMYAPESGREVRKHTVADVQAFVGALPTGSRVYLTVPLIVPQGRGLAEHLGLQLQQGYSRLWVDGAVIAIEDYLEQSPEGSATNLHLIIDRLQWRGEAESLTRLGESAELAFFEGRGCCFVYWEDAQGQKGEETFSNIFEADGRLFQEPSPEMFSFNNPVGACPECEGFGQTMGIEEGLVVPNPALSVYEGAVAAWRGEVSSQWKVLFCELASSRGDFRIHTPYIELTDGERKLLWEGIPYEGDDYVKSIGINSYFDVLKRDIHKVQNRVRLSNFRGKTICPSCHGGRLKADALCVRVGGKNIAEVVCMTLEDALVHFQHLSLDPTDAQIAERLLVEIKNRLQVLIEVGLGYLTLDRLSATLSGGESQRVTLASQLGNNLVGSLYVLDEPSIGLHQRDTDRLIGVMKRLRDQGNTVVVVEHDEDVIRSADYLIDIGPEAGVHGGQVVYAGPRAGITADTPGHTAAFLSGREQIPMPTVRRSWNSYIEIIGARRHNLKGVDVRIPLHTMTVVTGVSGSGKSTLIRDIFVENVRRRLDAPSAQPVFCLSVGGDIHTIAQVEYVDQNNIGRNSRSNPVTFIGAYDHIRRLFSEQPLSQRMGYKPYYFSFNKEGGRCEECKGDGYRTVEMQFMADITLPCEDCSGTRFRRELLDIEFAGVNIHQVLEMSVEEAIAFFRSHAEATPLCATIAESLVPLQTVGLGYIKLGQSSSTLSGGENQRVKLAYYLASSKRERMLFIFDEPTTGLHLADIRTLLSALSALVDRGHSLVIVEHNLEVIKSADWVIDLGPEAGVDGGQLVVAGTPEQVAACPQSHTGRYLSPLLHRNKK